MSGPKFQSARMKVHGACALNSNPFINSLPYTLNMEWGGVLLPVCASLNRIINYDGMLACFQPQKKKKSCVFPLNGIFHFSEPLTCITVGNWIVLK